MQSDAVSLITLMWPVSTRAGMPLVSIEVVLVRNLLHVNWPAAGAFISAKSA